MQLQISLYPSRISMDNPQQQGLFIKLCGGVHSYLQHILTTSMVDWLNFVTLALALASSALAFPSYASLAGLPREELDQVMPTLKFRAPEKPPGPLKFNGTKLVNDALHPWKPLKKGDIRGPCPGLNTLASHGVCLPFIWSA